MTRESTCRNECRVKSGKRHDEHIKEGLLERGEVEDSAEEIAARTVNKERARCG